jgi:hypothetical protein
VNEEQAAAVQVDKAPMRRLRVATVLLAVSMLINPVLVRWAWGDIIAGFVIVGGVPAAPLLIFGMIALAQAKAGKSSPTFAAAPLASAMLVLLAWTAGSAVAGYFIILLGALTLPASAVLVTIAWVQPPPRQWNLTALLAVALLPFIVWFAGRADEYPAEAVIAGGAIVVIVTMLWLIRRSRVRTEVHQAETQPAPTP